MLRVFRGHALAQSLLLFLLSFVAKQSVANRAGGLAGLFREEGDAMRLERGIEDGRVAVGRRGPDELHELGHDLAVAAAVVAVLLRDDRRRIAEERQYLDLVLVRYNLAASAVEVRYARTLLGVALHLEDDREPAVVLHEHRLVVNGVVATGVDAAAVGRLLDNVENRLVGLVSEMVPQVGAVVVDLVRVERTVLAD